MDSGGPTVVDADEVRRIGSLVDGIAGIRELIVPHHTGFVATTCRESGSGEGKRGEGTGGTERFHTCVEELGFVCVYVRCFKITLGSHAIRAKLFCLTFV